MGKPRSGDFVEKFTVGRGYVIQDQALARLGEQVSIQFGRLSTSEEYRQFAETHKDRLSSEEYLEFIDYANYISLLFGYPE